MTKIGAQPEAVDVEIRRMFNLSHLQLLDEESAGSEDGIALNLAYFDVRGWNVKDVELVQEEELALLAILGEAGWTTDSAGEILEEYLSDYSELSGFDAGVGAAVYALSAAGATPISSCNGGTIGQGYHSETTPSILFAAGEGFQPELIMIAAEKADLGLIPNREFAELFADQILKFHDFSRILTALLKTRPP